MELLTMQDEKRDNLRLCCCPFWKETLTSWSTDRIDHLIAICHHWHQQADHKTPPSCCSSSMLVLFDVLRCSGLIKTNVASRLWKGSTVWEHIRCLFSTVMLQTRGAYSSGVIRQLDHDPINRWIKRGFCAAILHPTGSLCDLTN